MQRGLAVSSVGYNQMRDLLAAIAVALPEY
jgi:hypothetical protein